MRGRHRTFDFVMSHRSTVVSWIERYVTRPRDLEEPRLTNPFAPIGIAMLSPCDRRSLQSLPNTTRTRVPDPPERGTTTPPTDHRDEARRRLLSLAVAH